MQSFFFFYKCFFDWNLLNPTVTHNSKCLLHLKALKCCLLRQHIKVVRHQDMSELNVCFLSPEIPPSDTFLKAAWMYLLLPSMSHNLFVCSCQGCDWLIRVKLSSICPKNGGCTLRTVLLGTHLMDPATAGVTSASCRTIKV